MIGQKARERFSSRAGSAEQPKPTKPMPVRCFVGDSDFHELTRTLERTTERCTVCDANKLHICLERICRSQAVFCISCDANQHRLHRVNELQMALVDAAYVPTRSKQTLKFLNHIVESLQEELTNVKAIYRSSQALIPSIQEAYEVFANLRQQYERISGIDHLETLHKKAEHSIGVFRRASERIDDRATTQKHFAQARASFIKELKKTVFFEQGIKLSDNQRLVKTGSQLNQLEQLISNMLNSSTSKSPKGWSATTEALKTKLYSSDRTALLNETALNRYVSKFWKDTIQIQPSIYRNLLIGQQEINNMAMLPCKGMLVLDSSKQIPNNTKELRLKNISGNLLIPEGLLALQCPLSMINIEDKKRYSLKKLTLVDRQHHYYGHSQDLDFKKLVGFRQLRALTVENSAVCSNVILLKKVLRFAMEMNLRSLLLRSVNYRVNALRGEEGIEQRLPPRTETRLLSYHNFVLRRMLARGQLISRGGHKQIFEKIVELVEGQRRTVIS